jgi:hypothetical protein
MTIDRVTANLYICCKCKHQWTRWNGNENANGNCNVNGDQSTEAATTPVTTTIPLTRCCRLTSFDFDFDFLRPLKKTLFF